MMGLMLTNDNTWMRTIKIDGWRTGTSREVREWCETRCTGEYLTLPTVVAFANEADAVFFQLAFGK